MLLHCCAFSHGGSTSQSFRHVHQGRRCPNDVGVQDPFGNSQLRPPYATLRLPPHRRRHSHHPPRQDLGEAHGCSTRLGGHRKPIRHPRGVAAAVWLPRCAQVLPVHRCSVHGR